MLEMMVYHLNDILYCLTLSSKDRDCGPILRLLGTGMDFSEIHQVKYRKEVGEKWHLHIIQVKRRGDNNTSHVSVLMICLERGLRLGPSNKVFE